MPSHCATLLTDSSVIVPAMLEIWLPPHNRRHLNLLQNAKAAGVTLYITAGTVSELVSIFNASLKSYTSIFAKVEPYLDDEMRVLFVSDMAVRAYLSAKKAGFVKNYADFLSVYIGPKPAIAVKYLTVWLCHEMGISSISDTVFDEERLKRRLSSTPLRGRWRSQNRKLLLPHIGSLSSTRLLERTVANQYWLLSKKLPLDPMTVFCSSRPSGGCLPLLRADFLYNIISFGQGKGGLAGPCSCRFPTMMGVNMSFCLPKESTDLIQHVVLDTISSNSGSPATILRKLLRSLKTIPCRVTPSLIKKCLKIYRKV